MSGRTLTIDGAVTPDELRVELSKICKVRGGQAELSRKTGLRQSTISSVLAGRLPINGIIANALGYVKPAFYMPARPQGGV